jgi:hypothetical protein
MDFKIFLLSTSVSFCLGTFFNNLTLCVTCYFFNIFGTKVPYLSITFLFGLKIYEEFILLIDLK